MRKSSLPRENLDTCFGHHHIHGDIVIIRPDAGCAGQLEADADAKWTRMHGDQRAVEIAAPITQPVTVDIKRDQREENDIRAAYFATGRDRDTVDVRVHCRIHRPGAKLHGGPWCGNGRNAGLPPTGHQVLYQGATIKFVMDRPAKSQRARGAWLQQIGKVGPDGRRVLPMQFRRQGLTGRNAFASEGGAKSSVLRQVIGLGHGQAVC
jgi:hypothetical protein